MMVIGTMIILSGLFLLINSDEVLLRLVSIIIVLIGGTINLEYLRDKKQRGRGAWSRNWSLGYRGSYSQAGLIKD